MRTLSLALILATAIPALPAAGRQPSKIEGGLISGAPGKDASITVFKGIPYAAPPVGSGRWAAPGAVKPWSGVRAADRFGASCIQIMVADVPPVTHEFMAYGDVSEDCLFLNVWTAARSASEKRPVLMYIHGGGFTGGSGGVPVYDGEGLAKKGLVVVTVNYRLGVFGFLAHSELTRESGHNASGNYGLMDQVAALQWIRKNIAAFGGDPGRVTIAGQSAGGMSVHNLIASPLAKGLFHRAVVESGGSSVGGGGIPAGSRGLADAEAEGQRFAASKGAQSLADLRAMSWQKLIETVATQGGGRAGGMRFSPIVDGYFLPRSVRETIQQGKQNDVPTLTGVNTGELGGLMGAPPPPTAESFRTQAERRYGSSAARFLELYPAATDEQAHESQVRNSRDSSLVSLYLWARERSTTAKTPAYLYLWDHALPGPDAAKYGAFHTSEVPYVLNTLDRSDRPFVEADRKIAEMMSSYWANFAASGDPNGRGLPKWVPAGVKPEIMEVGDSTGPIPPADTDRFAFFEKLLMR